MRGLLVVVLALLTAPLAVPASAQVLAAPSVTAQTPVAAGEDYATVTFGDRWDYAGAGDVILDEGPARGLDAATVADGVLRFEADSTAFVPLVFQGYHGALGAGREGLANPIDAGRFTHLAVRFWTPVDITMGAFYSRCLEGCEGHVSFFAQAGWNTYLVDLATPAPGMGNGEPWAGRVFGLRLAVAAPDGARRAFVLDDVRLFTPAGPDWQLSYANPVPHVPGQPARLIWDRDADPGNNTADSNAWGVLAQTYDANATATFTPGMLGAGPVWFHVVASGLVSGVAGPYAVEAMPAPRVLDPDAAGGEDFVTAHSGDPWDFDQPSDGAVGGAHDVAWAGGALHATNAGNDPFVELRLPGPVDTRRYHRLTVVADYDGPFDLADAAAGGTHGRLLWRVDGLDRWIDGRELVTYTGEDTYSVDLLANLGGPAYDDDAPAIPWDSAPAVRLRYDPNEDRGARRWRVHELRLAADDEASGGRFTVRWDDAAALPGTTVQWFADTDAAGFDGVAISAPLAQQPGQNAFVWDNTQVASGRYWLYAVSQAGVAIGRAYSTGPVQVTPFAGAATPPVPVPTPDPAPTEPTFAEPPPEGMRMAGPSRVGTAVAVSVAAFPDGAPVAVLARDDSFPDALAAAPLAAAHGGPLLLNPSAALHPDVAAELARLGAVEVLLMGGPAAQSEETADALRDLGLHVERVAGNDRFATAAAAAEAAVAQWRRDGVDHAGETAVVATGNAFADALAAGPLAVAHRGPLLLVAGDVLPDVTLAALSRLDAERVLVAGGPAAVAETVASGIQAHGHRVNRLAGADRFATGVVLAEAALDAGASASEVLVASGLAFPDALAAGPAAASLGGVLLLTDPSGVPDPVAAWVSLHADDVDRLRVVGGPGAIADHVLNGLARLLSEGSAR